MAMSVGIPADNSAFHSQEAATLSSGSGRHVAPRLKWCLPNHTKQMLFSLLMCWPLSTRLNGRLHQCDVMACMRWGVGNKGVVGPVLQMPRVD